ncbi:DUF2868 domain-containing protein [Allohahella marinimesophila]|uniref:DUF2868 domain-containing protein n=1 Tax=Allohahella marinimesophila TaxID=1054972 RepID=A0ABP7PKU0_9GAMM
MQRKSGSSVSSAQPVSRSLRYTGYRLEFVRYIEQQPDLISPVVIGEAEAGALSEAEPNGQSSGFERIARARASWLLALLRLDALHARVDRAAGQSLWVLCLLFGLLGAGAAAQGFDLAQHTVNFFWLLVVLLGVHTAALLFWLLALIGRQLRATAVKTPMLQVLALWLVRKLSRLFAHEAPEANQEARSAQPPLSVTTVSSVWARLQSRGALGFWNVSVLSHAIWAAYLIGGFAMTLILLSLRQYDFIWATTVLSAEAFEQMTLLLGELPRLLGVAVPDAQVVRISRAGIDSSPEIAGASRVLWSNLLLASLIIWGLLPRTILLIVSLTGRVAALRTVAVDFASPYYVALRQQLLTGFQRGGVIDPDRRSVPEAEVGHVSSVPVALPDTYDIAAIYLDPQLHWPPAMLQPQNNLGCIDDAASEQAVMAAAADTSSAHLVLWSHLSTVPDRGVRRIVQALKRHFRGRLHLGLLTPADRPADASRLEDWYRLAAATDISLDDLIQLPLQPDGSPDTSAVGGNHHAG